MNFFWNWWFFLKIHKFLFEIDELFFQMDDPFLWKWMNFFHICDFSSNLVYIFEGVPQIDIDFFFPSECESRRSMLCFSNGTTQLFVRVGASNTIGRRERWRWGLIFLGWNTEHKSLWACIPDLVSYRSATHMVQTTGPAHQTQCDFV